MLTHSGLMPLKCSERSTARENMSFLLRSPPRESESPSWSLPPETSPLTTYDKSENKKIYTNANQTHSSCKHHINHKTNNTNSTNSNKRKAYKWRPESQPASCNCHIDHNNKNINICKDRNEGKRTDHSGFYLSNNRTYKKNNNNIITTNNYTTRREHVKGNKEIKDDRGSYVVSSSSRSPTSSIASSSVMLSSSSTSLSVLLSHKLEWYRRELLQQQERSQNSFTKKREKTNDSVDFKFTKLFSSRQQLLSTTIPCSRMSSASEGRNVYCDKSTSSKLLQHCKTNHIDAEMRAAHQNEECKTDNELLANSKKEQITSNTSKDAGLHCFNAIPARMKDHKIEYRNNYSARRKLEQKISNRRISESKLTMTQHQHYSNSNSNYNNNSNILISESNEFTESNNKNNKHNDTNSCNSRKTHLHDIEDNNCNKNFHNDDNEENSNERPSHELTQTKVNTQNNRKLELMTSCEHIKANKNELLHKEKSILENCRESANRSHKALESLELSVRESSIDQAEKFMESAIPDHSAHIKEKEHETITQKKISSDNNNNNNNNNKIKNNSSLIHVECVCANKLKCNEVKSSERKTSKSIERCRASRLKKEKENCTLGKSKVRSTSTKVSKDQRRRELYAWNKLLRAAEENGTLQQDAV